MVQARYCSSVLLLTTLLGHTTGLQVLRVPELSGDVLEDAVLVGLDGDALLMKKRGSEQQSGLWFGRRDRRSADDVELDMDDSKDDVVELIKEAPWALVPIKGGKRHPFTFTPRLGRASGEEEDASSATEQRVSQFAPRLGRRLIPFAPRLGRDQVYSPRLGRSLAPGGTSAAQNKQR